MPRDMQIHLLVKRQRHPINTWRYVTACGRTLYAKRMITDQYKRVTCLHCKHKRQQARRKKKL